MSPWYVETKVKSLIHHTKLSDQLVYEMVLEILNHHRKVQMPPWVSNYIHYKMWNEITNPFLNFNGATVEV